METLQKKILDVDRRLEHCEEKLVAFESRKRIIAHLRAKQASSARLQRVPSDYYSWNLQKRASQLHCSVPQLTKTIILENIACPSNTECSDPTYSRYYAVIVQYVAKVNTEKLRKVIRQMKPGPEQYSRKQLNFQHAPSEVSESLSGFLHNAVSPFGMKTRIPVVLSSAITELPTPAFVWMGGGHEHVKLGISLSDLICSLDPIIADVSEKRTDLEQ